MIAMIPEEPKRRQAVEWVERGNELYEGGYYEDAIELFGRALECYDRTLDIRADRSRCLG